jgi:hypothetical protein
MTAYHYAQTLANRVRDDMAAIRQAERDAAQYCNGMAFDGADAEEIYRNALEHCGVPRSDTAGIGASSLRVILRNLPTPGSPAWRAAPPMAFDSASHGPSVLASILKGIKPPRDISHRNDFRRCL